MAAGTLIVTEKSGLREVRPPSRRGERVAASRRAEQAAQAPGELMLRLWPRPASCSPARHAVRSFCIAQHVPELADDAELLTSELMTNAIKYTGGVITLVAMRVGAELTISVRDDGQGAARVAGPAGTSAESGRGLQLVDQIASEWGSTRHSQGKSLWFRLP